MSNHTTLELEFQPGAVATATIQSAVSDVLLELADSHSEAHKAAVEADLNPTDFADTTVQIGTESKGFVISSIVIAIGAPVAAHVINKLWDDVIWPRIKDTHGADALGKRKNKKED